MRIAIDARALGSGRGGDESYTRGLLSGLGEVMDDADEFVVLARAGAILPKSVQGHSGFRVREIAERSEFLRYTLALPLALHGMRDSLDALHSVIYAPAWSPVPVALMVTDISFRHYPQFYRRSTRLRLNALMPLQLRRARVVMTLSEFCKRDIVAEYGVAPERVFVIPCAVEPPEPVAESQSILEVLSIRPPYFLYVGNRHPRKNIPRLINAFSLARRSTRELADHELVIAGARWWDIGDELAAASAAPAGSVRFVDQVTARTRDALMFSAQALVYPSLFEGFGLPPLEAMSAGIPVIASNVTAIPETVGDAAVLVDPLDMNALAAAMVQVATSTSLRATLSERGRRRAARYTARSMGDCAMAAFDAALKTSATAALRV